MPVQADADAGQPPSLPEVDPNTLPEPSTQQGSIAAEFERITRLNNPEHVPPNAQSTRLSRRVLVLFSGPYSRPDGLISFLRKEGLHVSAIDNDSKNGGDPNHDLLKNTVYESLLRRVQRGEFLGVFAAPPCSTFSISRFYRSSDSPDGGPPVIRRRSSNQVEGIHNCPAAHLKELRRSNELIAVSYTHLTLPTILLV